MPAWFRAGLFWVTGVLVSLAVIPMATTGALMAFEREITAWLEADVRVVDTGAAPLWPSQLIRRAAPELPTKSKPNMLQLHHDRTAPALLATAGRIWLVNPYDGHVLGPIAASLIRIARRLPNPKQSPARCASLRGAVSRLCSARCPAKR